MIFEDILPILKQGRRVRRSMWAGQPRYIRVADPLMEKSLDGPEILHAVFHAGAQLGEAFEDEADAKKYLTQLKKENTAEWKRYKDLAKSLADHPDSAKADLLSKAKPSLPEDLGASVEINAISAPRKDRINRPCLLATGRDGSIYPYVLQITDLLASDWQIA